MAVTQNKNQRIARWERKNKQNTKEKRIRAVLKDRKRQRKLERGVDQILRYAPTKRSGAKYMQACEQLWHIAHKLKFAKATHLARPGYYGPNNAYLQALANMADRYEMWVRDPADFQARSYNPERQFSELARHLFARYDPPAIFEQAWFETAKRKGRKQQTWYIQLAQGESPRRLSGLPITLTKRAAHVLFEVPDTLRLEQGLRWAQLRGMGASRAMADALLASQIGTDFGRDEFWLTVVRYLVDQPMLDPNRVGPIIDYIYDQRYRQHERLVNGRIVVGPAQPNFTMKGRCIDRLLTQVDEWHEALARATHRQRLRSWKPSGIVGHAWIEGRGKSLKLLEVVELLDTKQLIDEGGKMSHCVGSYDWSCAARRCAIFSLRCEAASEGGEAKRLVTIEVVPKTMTIVQARGKRNAEPTAEQMRMLRIWALHAGLQLAEWL